MKQSFSPALVLALSVLIGSCASPEQQIAESAVEVTGAALAEAGKFVVVESAQKLGEAASRFELYRSDVDKMLAVYPKGKRVVQVVLDSGIVVPCTRLECKYPLDLSSSDGKVKLSGTFVLTREQLEELLKAMDKAKANPKSGPVPVGGGAFVCLSEQCKPETRGGKR